MIFVTIGTSPFGFERLIKEMDVIAGKINEEVIMQIGDTDYEPRNARCFRYTSRDDILNYYNDARIVISHAAVGSILMAFHHNKNPILVPRLKEYGEVFDDHQLEISKHLEKKGINIVYDIKDLERALKNPSMNFIHEAQSKELIIRLKKYLDTLNS